MWNHGITLVARERYCECCFTESLNAQTHAFSDGITMSIAYEHTGSSQGGIIQ